MILAIISVVVLAALSLLAFGEGTLNRPEPLEKIYQKLEGVRTRLGYWGIIYGFIAFVLSLVIIAPAEDMIMRVIANIMIIVIALPFGYLSLMRHFPDINNYPAVAHESRNLVEKIHAKHKFLGLVGAGIALVLFVVTFS